MPTDKYNAIAQFQIELQAGTGLKESNKMQNHMHTAMPFPQK